VDFHLSNRTSGTAARDRLAGALCSDAQFAARVRAFLAVGVIAVVAGGSATSVASEPDQEREGSGAPDQGVLVAPEPPAPSVDPSQGSDGGADTTLPVPVAPAPAPVGGDGDGAGSVEAPPVDDPYGRLVLSAPDTPPSSPPDSEDAPDGSLEEVPVGVPEPVDGADSGATAPEGPGTAPAAPADPPGATAPTPAPLSPEAPDSDQTLQPNLPIVELLPDPRSRRNKGRPAPRKGPAKRQAVADRPPAAAPAEPVAQVVEVAPAAAPAAAQPVENAAPAPAQAVAQVRITGRFHVVRRGESLWLIARARLGPGASTAAVVKEVARLWRLNKRRIGTGDPSLLPVGVRLRLR
jgi:hypothetical protein